MKFSPRHFLAQTVLFKGEVALHVPASSLGRAVAEIKVMQLTAAPKQNINATNWFSTSGRKVTAKLTAKSIKSGPTTEKYTCHLRKTKEKLLHIKRITHLSTLI